MSDSGVYLMREFSDQVGRATITQHKVSIEHARSSGDGG
uniref:Uncharacterized protein n=1 Tax=Pseudomonas aeruginosa TaxID=287 RepID=A0A7S5YEB6_PSEAI|nr:hypothetical protein [Pseudomonas aeruginosa]